MTNSLAVYEQMNSLQTAADALHASGFFKDVTSKAQAMVKVMAGAEMGLGAFASMTGIHLVQGKPVLGSNLIATLVKNDPRYNYRVKQADNKACILTWYEGGQAIGESSFTWDEATAAGLTGKDNWKKYPSDMLFARALTRGARRYAPGIFGGAPVYTPEEMGADTDEDGHVIQGEVVNVTPPPNNLRKVMDNAGETIIDRDTLNNMPAVIEPWEVGGNPIEKEIATAAGREFVPLAAKLLEVTEDAIKERMRALGYDKIPGNPFDRVAAFRKVREYRAAELFPPEQPQGNGAYDEA